MDLQLNGKRAFISGSTQGIGLAIAKQLLQEGAEVIINGRDEIRTTKILKLLEVTFPNSKISAISADFSKKNEVHDLLSKLEKIDILINNVGVFALHDILQMAEDEWDAYFEIISVRDKLIKAVIFDRPFSSL